MKRSRRIAAVLAASFGLVSIGAADALAQGCPRGGYPPPFRPTGVVTKGPSPAPTPGPTPTPRSAGDPTPGPNGGPRGTTPGVGRPHAGTTNGGTPLRSTGSFDWEAWWEANQWRYLEFRPIVGETAEPGDAANGGSVLTPAAIASIVAALRAAAASSDDAVAAEALAALAAVAGNDAAADVATATAKSGRVRLAGIRAASRLPAASSAGASAASPAASPSCGSLKTLLQNRSAAPSERGAAAVVLSVLGGAMPEFAAIARLVEDRSESPDVRAGAALALALSCGHEGIDVLARRVADTKEVPTMRSAAAFALGRTGDRCAVSPLSRALADENSSEPLRRAAAASLGAVAVRQEHPLDGEARREAADTLIGAVRNDERLAVRSLAVLSLGQVGGVDAKLECRRILEQGPAELVSPALLALGLLGDAADGEIVARYLSADAEFRPAAALACGLVRHASARLAIRSMLESSGDAAALRMAAIASGLLGDTAAIPLLESRVGSPASTRVGEAALVGLGLMGHVTARAAVRRAADEARDLRTRSAAFEVLGRMRDPGSPKRLESVLAATSRASAERSAAARALGLLGSPATALPPLEDVMIDRDPELATPLVSTLVAAAN